MRIISVVPSFTELLLALNLGDDLVGRTKFCIHPKEALQSIEKVGGTKKLNIQKIINLKPDLIIANKEENSKSDIEELQKHCSVWLTEIYSFEDALSVITDLGKKTNRIVLAQQLVADIRHQFNTIIPSKHSSHQRVAYLIWDDPIMLAGQYTFINEMMKKLAMPNILVDSNSRYPVLSVSKLQELDPDLILLSSEPFPYKEKHRLKYAALFPNSQVVLIDGEMFSWYGSRMKIAPNYFKELIQQLDSN